MPIIPKRIPKENVIGLACEPLVCLNISDTFIDYAIKNKFSKYFEYVFIQVLVIGVQSVDEKCVLWEITLRRGFVIYGR